MRLTDLNHHFNRDWRNGDVEFPVELLPAAAVLPDGSHQLVENRRVVVRTDTMTPLSVVSDGYTLVPHSEIISVIDAAVREMNCGSVPRGLFVEQGGNKMRAVYRFNDLEEVLPGYGRLCPVVQAKNALDAKERLLMACGAFSFVCTNLAVGGLGAFAAGFGSVHVGVIDLNEARQSIENFLARFKDIMRTYHSWMNTSFSYDDSNKLLAACEATKLAERDMNWLRANGALRPGVGTAFSHYSLFTDYYTHCSRSAQHSFRRLAWTNDTFQDIFPVGTGCSH